jgi:hypothetical protein
VGENYNGVTRGGRKGEGRSDDDNHHTTLVAAAAAAVVVVVVEGTHPDHHLSHSPRRVQTPTQSWGG